MTTEQSVFGIDGREACGTTLHCLQLIGDKPILPLSHICVKPCDVGDRKDTTVKELPFVASNRIEGLVIEHRHQLCLVTTSLRVSNLERPFLFLSRHGLIAESAPRYVEPLIGQGTLYLYLVAIVPALLYPGVCHGDAVSPFGFIHECLCNRVGIKAHHALFYHLFICSNNIWRIYILEVCSDGDTHLTAFFWECF